MDFQIILKEKADGQKPAKADKIVIGDLSENGSLEIDSCFLQRLVS